MQVHQVHRADIIATLRSRGLDDRADWAERQLPEAVDTVKNAALLRMLNIDISGMTPVENAAPPA
jgi:lambda repressor-like predicted transcriptional regulator